MRSICKVIPTIGACVIALSSAAFAADVPRMPSLPPMAEAPPLLVDEFSSGWYLRGDVGYRYNNKVDRIDSGGPASPALDDSLPNGWAVGAGFGYKLDWFRSDLTVDYAPKMKFTSDSALQSNDYRTKVDNAVALWNVYGDLGTWWGFTPYVGAGAGVAWLQTSDFKVASAGLIDGGPHASDQWNFAWGYMAGISYKFNGNYSIDIGYRHINMGDVPTTRDSTGNRLVFKGLESDEVRVGFRYAID